MKADSYGTFSEQQRANAGWRTALKGEVRCDACVYGKEESRSNGGANAITCKSLKVASKPNATCNMAICDVSPITTYPDNAMTQTTENHDLVLYDRHRIVGELKFYMSQSAEAMLEAGKRLIELKDNEPHGEFERIVEQELHLEVRTAQKMMKAAIKFMSPQLESKANALSLLGKTKLFELMSEDDGELAELADGGKLAGMTLDDIDRMTTRELKAKLRKTETDAFEELKKLRGELDAKDRKLKSRAEEISELKDKLDDKKVRQVDEDPMVIKREGYIKDLMNESINIHANISAALRQRCLAVLDAHDVGSHDEHARLVVSQALGLVANITRNLAIDLGINPNQLPETNLLEAMHGEGGASWQAVNEAMNAQGAEKNG